MKYGSSLKNSRILGFLSQLGLIAPESEKSHEIYETYRDYMSLEQCSSKEALDFTAKFYRLSKHKTRQILEGFSQA
jgi:hypothetical protein